MKSQSRRQFLKQAAAIPLVSCRRGLRLFSLPALPGAAAIFAGDRPRFSHPHIIRYDAQCFTIHDRDVFLYSAAFHYCRTPKALWRDRMLKLKLAGFNTIETYVFWNYHEPVEGQVDMTELEDFIQLTRELGLWMILRVGPYVCAEWDAGGFPHWIIAKQFPLRSDSPESIQTSQGWYNHVLPVVRRNMITEGGPVILVQIENEYDYWHIPDAQKMNYITALAHMVWDAGIDIPIFTNWVSQARENSNPVMARIMDTGDFYPRWNIQKEVVPALATLRKEEPSSPVGIAELQGGWFSQYGGQLSEEQDGVSAAQLNLLTKTVIECGTAFTNFYMAHGGTNFEWAARKVTTTYDYAAPIREPGGLWNKYYAARTIGSFLQQSGPAIVRAGAAENIPSTNPKVSVTMRKNGKTGFLFVRQTDDSDQDFTFTWTDPGTEVRQQFTVPAEGKLAIRAHGMKVLPVQLPISGGLLRYSTAEVLTFGSVGQRNYLIVFGEPGEAAEIALAAEKPPSVHGALRYRKFDAGSKTAIFGFKVELSPQMFLWNELLHIIVLPRALAERTWAAQLPASGGVTQGTTPVITDCALMSSHTSTANSAAIELEYGPGEHVLTTLATASPKLCMVNGQPVHFHFDPFWKTVQLGVSTPALPPQALTFSKGEFLVQHFRSEEGEWLETAPGALEQLGRLPYGYVRYQLPFQHRGEKMLFLETHTEDPKQVFLNGKRVPELSSPAMSVSCVLDDWVTGASNVLEISYEAFGSENGNAEMAQLKGIQAIRLGDAQQSHTVPTVAVQRFPPGVTQHGVDLSAVLGEWKETALGFATISDALTPAFTWFRVPFVLRENPEWFAPWKLRINADRDTLIYVNGHFIGYYQAIGPQSEFYVPEPFLYLDGKKENMLALQISYTDGLHSLRQLVLTPYTEFATRKTKVELCW